MKVKFVRVWDDRRWGYVKHIILQVEESDTFLTEENFNSGYKFVIQAVYHQVGAAGGHDFNPYHGNRVRDLSTKIDSTESDVLGFYLGKIKDIYDIPQDLYTDSFWNVVRTDGYSRSNKDYYDDCDSYYKVLHTSIYSYDELCEKLLEIKNSKDEFFDKLDIDIDLILKRNQEHFDRLDEITRKFGATPKKPSKSIRFAIIDKESLEIVNDTWSTSAQSTIADYLWCPCDEIPDSLWQKVIDKNDLGAERIYKINEEIMVN